MAVSAFGIKQIAIFQEGLGNIAVQKDVVQENNTALSGGATQSWKKGSLVYTAGTGADYALNGIATDGVLVYGLSPDSAVGTGATTPPTRLFGLNHYAFDVRDRILEITAVSGSNPTLINTTSGVTWAGGGTGGVALAVGQQYAIYVPASGTYTGFNFLDVDDTTNKLFEIVGLYPGEVTSANSPRLLVKVISTKIQG